MTTPGTEGGGTQRESVFYRLYTGTGAFNIVGNRKRWYIAFGLVVLICLGGIGIRGFNLGIDFVGGTQIEMPASSAQGSIDSDEAQETFQQAVGQAPETVQVVGSGPSRSIQIQSETLDDDQVREARTALYSELQPVNAQGQSSPQVISDSAVSGTWGGEITRQAVLALVVFVALVTVFLVFYFERWMALSAIITLFYDLAVTAGVYSLAGFEVTPATVIGLLTILGYSLYDTVVVFDKLKENTRGLLSRTRRTYSEAANLAVNQTLMRSINTSIVALLPVLGLLIVGSWIFGIGVLRELGLVQGVGMLVGTVSSVLLAAPLLVTFKMREQRYRDHTAQVYEHRERAANGDGASGATPAGGATNTATAGTATPGTATAGTGGVSSVSVSSGGVSTSGTGTSGAEGDSASAASDGGDSTSEEEEDSGGGSDTGSASTTRGGAASKPPPGAKPVGKSSRGSSGKSGRPSGKANRPSGKRRR